MTGPSTGTDAARWRSVLFVPGDRPELAPKALRCGPDVVVLDLEDAVPPAGKVAAREAVRASVAALVGQVRVGVRVNPPGTEWYADDVMGLPEGVDAVVVPKLDTPSQLAAVADAVGGRPVVAGLETVRGALDARLVLGPPVVACYFGAEDYVADLGGTRTSHNAEVAYPRAHVAAAARLAGVPALDMVTIDFRDHDRFAAEARDARALGYAGKLCIHPDQVALAHEAFRPSADEVAWATELLAAFDEAGGRTIAFAGQMVDEVVAARARAVLTTAAADAPVGTPAAPTD